MRDVFIFHSYPGKFVEFVENAVPRLKRVGSRRNLPYQVFDSLPARLSPLYELLQPLRKRFNVRRAAKHGSESRLGEKGTAKRGQTQLITLVQKAAIPFRPSPVGLRVHSEARSRSSAK